MNGTATTTSPPSWSEAERLKALRRYQILDTPTEADFDDIAQLASDICGTPIAVVNLIDDGRQWFKAEVGLGVRSTPLETSFCAHAILQEDFMVVPDATKDPRFDCNPLVTGEAHLRFYAGALLKTAEGLPIGTLCVLGTQPKELTEHQEFTLRTLARQVMTQLELRLALRERRADEERNRLILESAIDIAIITMDLGGLVTSWNPGAERVFGWSEAEMLGQPGEVIFIPEDRSKGAPGEEIRTALTTGRALDERWHCREDGSRFWGEGEMLPLKGNSEVPEGLLKILRDRSERKAAQEQQAVLNEELKHRVKNTLAMVQAIANQSLRGAESLGQAADAFSARIISLGQAHDILTQTSWSGAPIAAVIEGALAVHREAGANRIRTGGLDLMLSPRHALSLALAMHELATNASKYGALSNAEGHVEVQWQVLREAGEPTFRLSWSEHGGPPVEPPSRKGFGSKLIERSLAAEFGGEARTSFAPTGFAFQLMAPLASLG